MSIRAEYVEAIERYGYTPTEARFLYLVATHADELVRTRLLILDFVLALSLIHI